MTKLFLQILNMSISATWLVLAVAAVRFALKKTPKWVNVLLWGLVAVRLLCPFTLESAMSLIPSTQTIPQEIMMSPTPQIQTGVESINTLVNPIIAESFTPEPAASANPLQILIPVASWIWVAGMVLMVLYSLLSYLSLRRKVRMAIRVKQNIYLSEYVTSPFVLGIVKPRIYLPYHMAEPDRAHVIAHERTHIHRRDHWWKPLGFGLLTLHWFNPFLWVAYLLLCRDIEMACDEKVIQTLTRQQRADYSQALLHCSVTHRSIAACPLAFGEVGVKDRVKNVLRYQKPAFWVILISLVVMLVLSICFLTDPKTLDAPFDQIYYVETVSYTAQDQNFRHSPETITQVQLTKDGALMLLDDSSDNWFLFSYNMEETTLTKENFYDCFIKEGDWMGSGPETLLQENKKAWQVADPPEQFGSAFYYLLQQKDGSIYLVRGVLYGDQKTQAIHNVYKLLPEGAIPLAGKTFQVSGFRYADPLYSSTWQFKGDLPYLSVTHNGHILVRDADPTVAPDENAPWRDLGKAQDIVLTQENFDDLIQTESSQPTARELRQENQQAWTITGLDNTLYYLLRQKNNDLFLAYGQAGENASIRFLMKLEPVPDMSWSASIDLYHVNRTSGFIHMNLTGTLPDGVWVLKGETLQVKSGSTWQDVPALIEGLFHADQVIDSPNAAILDSLNWKETYGALPDGTYRIKETITLCTPDGQLESKDFYAEFTLGGDLSSQITFDLSAVSPTGLLLRENIPDGLDVIVEDFRLEVQENGQWKSLEPVTELEPIFADAERHPTEGMIAGLDYTTVTWDQLYGELPPGTYRLSRDYVVFNGQTPSLQTASALFTIAPSHGIHLVVDEVQDSAVDVDILLEDTVQPGTYFIDHLYLQNKADFYSYPLMSDNNDDGAMVDVLEYRSGPIGISQTDLLSWTQLRVILILTQVLPNGQEQQFALFEYVDPSNYAWGLTLANEAPSAEEVTILLTCPNTPFEKNELTYTASYKLEKREFNHWTLLEEDAQNTGKVYAVTPGTTASLSQTLPDLPNGTYCLTKQITRHYSDGTSRTLPLSTIFTIGDAAQG